MKLVKFEINEFDVFKLKDEIKWEYNFYFFWDDRATYFYFEAYFDSIYYVYNAYFDGLASLEFDDGFKITMPLYKSYKGILCMHKGWEECFI